MSKVEKANSWKTTDNRLFATEREANRHQRSIEFREWYDTNPLVDKVLDAEVDPTAVEVWLKSNAQIIVDFLNVNFDDMERHRK